MNSKNMNLFETVLKTSVLTGKTKTLPLGGDIKYIENNSIIKAYMTLTFCLFSVLKDAGSRMHHTLKHLKILHVTDAAHICVFLYVRKNSDYFCKYL